MNSCLLRNSSSKWSERDLDPGLPNFGRWCFDQIIYMLSYSPALTWRDVQHVIVRSARPAPGGVPLEGGGWVTNKAGLNVSRFFGFGLMDAGEMVHLAKYWTTVPRQLRCEIKSQAENRFDFRGLLWSFLDEASPIVIMTKLKITQWAYSLGHRKSSDRKSVV